ncbi:MAG: PD-(D/E)XK nuclease family protein [Rhodospirillales bacterium]|nr:PD-(D/E)XK nuclease family protein [Rhodospirillales bacterium]
MPKQLTDHEAALRHQYRVEPGGPTVPGVTTVINILDKPGMVWSAAQIAAETALKEHRRKATIVRRHRKTLTALGKKERELGYNGSDDDVFVHYCRGEHKRQWDAKMNRGTRVHEVAEAWTKNPDEPVKVLVEDSGYVDALESFHRECTPKFIEAELVVLNPDFGYGGRFDAIAEIDGEVVLIDYKTGNHYESSLAMQQVAYLHAGVATYDDAGGLRNTDAAIRSQVAGSRGVYLHEDGTYELVDPFKNITQEQAWRGFLACLETYKAMKDIDNAVKENS